MREEATLFQRIFYTYAKPLLDSSMTQQIKFEQYGDLPEHLRIAHESKAIEEQV